MKVYSVLGIIMRIVFPETWELSQGIAKEFRERFNHLEPLKSLNKGVNEICEVEENGRMIYYLITKENYWEKPTYETLFIALQNLKSIMQAGKINSISMPRLGCGLDGLKWHKVRTMLRFIFSGTDIKVTICHNRITNPNPDEIQNIIQEHHSTPVGGHKGITQTYKKLKFNYNWPHMKRDVRKFVISCDSCQKNKLVRKKTKFPMQITDTSQDPFEKVMLDIVGPLPLTESGNKYILTLQDDLTKFSQAYPIPNQETTTIANELSSKFICTFGIPKVILTDQGTNFTSDLFKDVAKLFKIKKVQSSAYHAQTNGSLERSHQTLADYLKHFISESQTDWDGWINFAMFSYNSTPHTTTRYSPYELVFGRRAEIPSSISKDPEFHYTYDDYLANLKLKLQMSNKIARENILNSKEKSKETYDRKILQPNFRVGDQVYLLNESTRPGRSKKLTNNYTGPYEIVGQDSPVNFTIRIKRKCVLVHANRLKHSQA